jgi:hypothetical protein
MNRVDRHQTSVRDDHGSRSHGDHGPGQAPDVGMTQGRAHPRLADSGPQVAVVASRVIVATVARPISQSLSRLNHGIECGRETVLSSGRQAACGASRLPRLAEILRRETTRRDAAKPFRVDPCACKPSGETHRRLPSSFVASDVKHNDRKEFASVRTAFQGGRNVFRG